MSKKIIGITLASLTGLSGAFAGGMVLANNIKDDNYTVVLAEKKEELDSICSSLENLNDEIAEKDGQIALLKVSNKTLEDEKASLESQLADKDAQILALQEEKDKLASESSQEIESLNSQIETLNEEKTQLETQLSAKNTEITNLNATITTLTSDKEKIEESYLTLEANYKSLETQYNALVESNSVDKKQIETLNSTISDLNGQIETLNSKVKELEEKLDNANSSTISIDVSSLGLSMDYKIKKLSSNNYLIYSSERSAINGIYLYDKKNDSILTLSNTMYGVYDSTIFKLSNENYLISGNSREGLYLLDLTDNSFSCIYSKGSHYCYIEDLGNGIALVMSDSTYGSLLKVDYVNKSYTCVNSSCIGVGFDSNEKHVLIRGENTYLYDIEKDTFSVLFEDFSFTCGVKVNDDLILLSSQTSSNKGIYLFDFSKQTLTLLIENDYYCKGGFVDGNNIYFCCNNFVFYCYNLNTKELSTLESSFSFNTSYNINFIGKCSYGILFVNNCSLYKIDNTNNISFICSVSSMSQLRYVDGILEIPNSNKVVLCKKSGFGGLVVIDLEEKTSKLFETGAVINDIIVLPNQEVLYIVRESGTYSVNNSYFYESGLRCFKIDISTLSSTSSTGCLGSVSLNMDDAANVTKILGHFSDYDEESYTVKFNLCDITYLYNYETGDITIQEFRV